jgi:hypothetical protein
VDHALEKRLTSTPVRRSFSATQADLDLVAAIGKSPNKDKFPHLFRYYSHISAIAGKAT